MKSSIHNQSLLYQQKIRRKKILMTETDDCERVRIYLLLGNSDSSGWDSVSKKSAYTWAARMHHIVKELEGKRVCIETQ